jgi:DNA-binding MurR/RpiR family transcriptional regulator
MFNVEFLFHSWHIWRAAVMETIVTELSSKDPAPASVDEVRERILRAYDGLPKRLRQCADYVLDHPENLAAGAAAQPSAFIRFCKVTGFTGFSEMQKLYREAHAGRWPDYATRLERLRERGGEAGALLADFVGAGHKSLNRLVETIDHDVLDRAVDMLCRAGTIHIIGLRRSFPTASYLSYVFEKMAIASMLHDGVGGLGARSAIRPGDALIAISFMPYTPETIALAFDAAERGVPVLSITDGAGSPLEEVPGEILTVREVDVGSFRALSATLTLATTIAVAVGAARSR